MRRSTFRQECDVFGPGKPHAPGDQCDAEDDRDEHDGAQRGGGWNQKQHTGRNLHESNEIPEWTGLEHGLEKEADGIAHRQGGEALSRGLHQAGRNEGECEKDPVHESEPAQPGLAPGPGVCTLEPGR